MYSLYELMEFTDTYMHFVNCSLSLILVPSTITLPVPRNLSLLFRVFLIFLPYVKMLCMVFVFPPLFLRLYCPLMGSSAF